MLLNEELNALKTIGLALVFIAKNRRFDAKINFGERSHLKSS
jgi:hypothetical protein